VKRKRLTLVLEDNNGGTPSDDLVIGRHGEYLGVAIESLRFPFGHVHYGTRTVHLSSPGYVVHLIVMQYRQGLKEQEKDMNKKTRTKKNEKRKRRAKKEQTRKQERKRIKNEKEKQAKKESTLELGSLRLQASTVM